MSILFRYCRQLAFAASFSVAAFACNDGGLELGPGDVRTLRILGVKSIPADPVSGETALLKAIVLNPSAEETAMLWTAVSPQSVLPSEGAGRGELQPTQVQFAGLVTPPVVFPRLTQPTFPLTATAAYVPGVEASAGITSAALVVLARSGPINITQLVNPDSQQDYLRSLLDDAVPAVKILRINDPAENENPTITDVHPTRRILEFDEETGDVDRSTELRTWDIPRGATLEAEATVKDESPLCESGDHKDYGKRGRSCVSFSWYAASGQVFGFVRSAELWRAPVVSGIYSLIVVARDRIGGLDWHIQDVNVGRPVEHGKVGRVLLKSKTTEPNITNASRLIWIPVDDPNVFADLNRLNDEDRVFTASMHATPDRSQRLALDFDPATFNVITSLSGVSIQAAAERELSGSISFRFQIEALERAGTD